MKYIIELINGESKGAGIDKQQQRKQWNILDKHRNGVLNRKSVITLVASLGIKFSNDSFLTAILRSSIGNSKCDQITFSQFSSLLYQLTRRPGTAPPLQCKHSTLPILCFHQTTHC